MSVVLCRSYLSFELWLLRMCVFVCRQFETVIPVEDSVITEMTSTLRDWGAMWKQLYVVSITHTCIHVALILDITSFPVSIGGNLFCPGKLQTVRALSYTFICWIDCVCGLLSYLGAHWIELMSTSRSKCINLWQKEQQDTEANLHKSISQSLSAPLSGSPSSSPKVDLPL